MLRFLICLFFIAEADKINDAALIKGVKDTLDVCSDIVEAVGDFLTIFEDRRRDSLGLAVVKKLKVCRRLVELVDKFRERKNSPPTMKPTMKLKPTMKPTMKPMKIGKISLRPREAQYLETVLKSVRKKMGRMLYAATVHGGRATNFQTRCAGQGPNVVIVLSTNGHVFGGYTDLDWKGPGGYQSSTTSFLFSLRPKTMVYRIRKDKTRYAIARTTSNGPVFGAGFDLKIGDRPRKIFSSYTNGGNTYQFRKTSGDYSLNMGVRNFKVIDYVVLKAIKL